MIEKEEEKKEEEKKEEGEEEEQERRRRRRVGEARRIGRFSRPLFDGSASHRWLLS